LCRKTIMHLCLCRGFATQTYALSNKKSPINGDLKAPMFVSPDI
jgi:hypothetical protein